MELLAITENEKITREALSYCGKLLEKYRDMPEAMTRIEGYLIDPISEDNPKLTGKLTNRLHNYKKTYAILDSFMNDLKESDYELYSMAYEHWLWKKEIVYIALDHHVSDSSVDRRLRDVKRLLAERLEMI